MTLLDAIAASDRDTLGSMLAEDVVFHSPVQTYRGRDQVLRLLVTIGGVIEDVEVTRQLEDVTFFAAKVEEHPVDGVIVAQAAPPRPAPGCGGADGQGALRAALARLDLRAPRYSWNTVSVPSELSNMSLPGPPLMTSCPARTSTSQRARMD
jgi:hypothetical protein